MEGKGKGTGWGRRTRTLVAGLGLVLASAVVAGADDGTTIGTLRVEDGRYVLDPAPGFDGLDLGSGREVRVVAPARSPYQGSSTDTRRERRSYGERFEHLSCAFDESPRCAAR